MSILRNIRKRGFKDILNPKRVLLFFRAKKHKQQDYIKIPYDNIESYCEQYIYRRFLCKPCYDANECTHCGCKAKEVIAEPTATCSADEWFEMLNPAQWEEQKKENGITIKVEFK